MSPGFSQSSVNATLVTVPPKIDGRVDDPAWQSADMIDQLYQREPYPGEPMTERTEFLFCYDKDNLYIACRCFGASSGITAKEMARDVSLGEDDRIQVILDTFLDRRNGYWFQIGPRGSIGDALVAQNGAIFNKEWDGLWDGRARILHDRWEAELVIPFKTLNFDPNRTTWGLKLIRHIKSKSESDYWPVGNANTYKFQISDSGLLGNLQGITQGIGLDVSPYGLLGMNQKLAADVRYIKDAGADVFYQITPKLKSALTVNTDFAQTEVDARQINLTRFKLHFPEKRDFFLDGANYFNFGLDGESESAVAKGLIPFFSRQMGLDNAGRPIPIVWGAKIVGRIADYSVGFLNITDERDIGRKNLSVARFSKYIGRESYVGAIGTLGNALAEVENHLLGLDLKLASSRFMGNKNISLTLYGLQSHTAGRSGRNRAFGGDLNLPNDFLKFRLGFRQIEENFIAGMGFVPRADLRQSYTSIALQPRPRRWGIQQVSFGTDLDYITTLDNQLLTRELSAPISITMTSGDVLLVGLLSQYEFLENVFQIHPRYHIPGGRYQFQRASVKFTSAKRRKFWAGAGYSAGQFYDGTRQDLSVALGYQIAMPLYLGLEAEQNRVFLAAGSFETHVRRLNLNLLFGPRMTVYNYIQYDNLSRRLGWQSRLRWILVPGNEILLVWNSIWLDPLDRERPLIRDFDLNESTTRLKLRYNYRF